MKVTSCFLSLCFVMTIACLAPALASNESQTIITFGDSLTEGCGNKFLDSCGVKCPAGKSCYDYGDNVEELLSKNNYKEYTVTNFGLGGEDTIEGLNRLNGVLVNSCNQAAQYIFIMQGTNDLAHKESLSTIKFNIDKMIEKSLAKGLTTFVATIPPDWTNTSKDISGLNTRIRSLVAQKIAENKDVILVDQYNILAPYWNSYTNPAGCYPDKLHPNKTGYYAMGEAWYDQLAALLPPRQAMGWLQLLLDSP